MSAAEVAAKAPCANGVTADCVSSAIAPPVLDDGDTDAQFPANELSGSVMTGASVLVPGLHVKFYVEPANALHDQTGDVLPLDYLGSATTDANGAFVFQLPSLDTYAQSVSNDNNGILNVLASVATVATLPTDSSAPSIAEYADADIPIRVGGSAQYFMSQPPVLTLEPATDTSSVDTTALAIAANGYDPTDPTLDPAMNYGDVSASTLTVNGAPVSADSYNPFIVNGIDYRSALPPTLVSGTAPNSTAASGPEDCSADPVYPMPVDGYPKVINAGDRNVIVGETHAYWDTKAGFEYGQNADSTIQVGFSTDATHWSVGGSVSVDNSRSAGGAEGFDARGPYYGYQQRMTFWFTETQYKWYCYDNNGNKITWSRYRVAPTRCTWTFSQGKDVSKYDGFDGWARSKTAYQNVVERNGGYIIITSGKAYHYSAGFNAFGASFGVVSGHSSYVQQKITAGNGQYEHDVWGNSGKPPATQIMYSW